MGDVDPGSRRIGVSRRSRHRYLYCDNSGAFQLRVLSGVTYVIRAGRTTGESEQTETVLVVGRENEAVRLTIRR